MNVYYDKKVKFMKGDGSEREEDESGIMSPVRNVVCRLLWTGCWRSSD